MERAAPAAEHTGRRIHRLAVIGGDGIGPEVVAEGIKVLDRLELMEGFSTARTHFDLGARRYLRTGTALDDPTLEQLRGHDALYLGAVGSPDVPLGVLGHGLLLRIRSAFEQYINLRPVRLHEGVRSPVAGLRPEDCDLVIVRENTESMYGGTGGRLRAGTAAEVATQVSVNTRHGVERVLRYSFGLARRRRGRLTLAHRADLLPSAGSLWRRVFDQLGSAEFADVERDYLHIGEACAQLVLAPHRFDVVVTDNLFGDVISDVGAALQGGLGLAASANINPTRRAPSMFEPVHGSAPDIAGSGRADPVAAVLSLGHLLAFLGEDAAADRLDAAVRALLTERPDRRLDGVAHRTSDVGDRLVELLARA